MNLINGVNGVRHVLQRVISIWGSLEDHLLGVLFSFVNKRKKKKKKKKTAKQKADSNNKNAHKISLHQVTKTNVPSLGGGPSVRTTSPSAKRHAEAASFKPRKTFLLEDIREATGCFQGLFWGAFFCGSLLFVPFWLCHKPALFQKQ